MSRRPGIGSRRSARRNRIAGRFSGNVVVRDRRSGVGITLAVLIPLALIGVGLLFLPRIVEVAQPLYDRLLSPPAQTSGSEEAPPAQTAASGEAPTTTAARPAASECDRLGAYPYDRDKVGAGVPSEILDASAVVAACRAAIERYPNKPRFLMQLGRGLLASVGGKAAMPYLRRAADQNYATAQGALALIYAGGYDVPRDDANSAEWARKAADQGDSLGRTMLGRLYMRGSVGNGNPDDLRTAMRLLLAAADDGHMLAERYIGTMYDLGLGVARDPPIAGKWYRKAAEKGDPYSQVRIGEMLLTGNGVEEDRAAAVGWFHRAAKQGQPLGQLRLGNSYLFAFGVRQDNESAYFWCSLSDARSVSTLAAGCREMSAKYLKPGVVARVDGLIRDWRRGRDMPGK